MALQEHMGNIPRRSWSNADFRCRFFGGELIDESNYSGSGQP